MAILDCVMPYKSGPEICEDVRRMEAAQDLPPLPIIILSGNSDIDFMGD
jgi:CheY-like chemotaxis protein